MGRNGFRGESRPALLLLALGLRPRRALSSAEAKRGVLPSRSLRSCLTRGGTSAGAQQPWAARKGSHSQTGGAGVWLAA